MYLSPFFSLSFSRPCRTRRRLIVANGPSSWRHERGNGIKPRRAARDLLIVTTSCRGAARRRASGRDSSQDSYIMCVHQVDVPLLFPLRFYLFIDFHLSIYHLPYRVSPRIGNQAHVKRTSLVPWYNFYREISLLDCDRWSTISITIEGYFLLVPWFSRVKSISFFFFWRRCCTARFSLHRQQEASSISQCWRTAYAKACLHR